MIATFPVSFMRVSSRDRHVYRPGAGPRKRSRPQRLERRERPRHDRRVALGLDARAEELDVPPAGVARVGEGPAQATERDVAVADDDAVVRRERPDCEVAHLDERDAVGPVADVPVKPPLDPRVVELEDDAYPRRRELVREVERLVEAVEEPEVHPELAHGLDREPDAEPRRVGDEPGEDWLRARRLLLPRESRRLPREHAEAARAKPRRRGEMHARPCDGGVDAGLVPEREGARRDEARDREPRRLDQG